MWSRNNKLSWIELKSVGKVVVKVNCEFVCLKNYIE